MSASGHSDLCQSRRVWSLWEMLDKHVSLFVAATMAFSEAKWVTIATEREGADNLESRKQLAKLGHHALHGLRRACILSDLDEVVPELDRLAQSFNMMLIHPEYKLDALGQAIKHLLSRIQDELSIQYYFHLDQCDVPFYLNEHPLGAAVSDKFSFAVEDIAEAGKCLAFQRPTACVFHLMRAMERVVQRFGKKLKVQINVHTETWHQIILHVDKAVLQMPSRTSAQKARKSKYAIAAAHLGSVRLAWRNEVMHPKQTYTRQEAFDIYNHCKVFMASLAELI